MVRTQDIDYAIKQTIKKEPIFMAYLNEILIFNTEKSIAPNNFTRENGAREMVKDATRYDIIHYLSCELTKVFNAANYYLEKIGEENFKAMFPEYGEIYRIMGRISHPNINAILYLDSHNKELISAINFISRYYQNDGLNNFINQNGEGITKFQGKEVDCFTKFEADMQMLGMGYSFKVFNENVNPCKLDLMSGAQLKNQRSSYSLSRCLYSTQAQGKRSKQEDSVIILEHPKNPNYRLLAVSDGMSGLSNADEVSRFALMELSSWFENINPDIFIAPKEFSSMLNAKIYKISDEIYRRYNDGQKEIKAGATLTCAVVAENSTIVSTVGDSRCYVCNNRFLDLLSKDDNYVWDVNQTARGLGTNAVDEMRFNPYNIYITKYLGAYNLDKIQCYILPNESYEKIILMTDGVTDLLSEKTIKVITNNTPTYAVADALVDEALNNSVYRVRRLNEEQKRKVEAGKGNATVAVFENPNYEDHDLDSGPKMGI